MFKLIFRIISIITFTIILVIALAVWKGGEPFRWLGEGTEKAGKVIQDIADRIDRIREGSKVAGKELKRIGKDIEEIKGTIRKQGKDGTTDQDRETE
jgi:hypothetical protein